MRLCDLCQTPSAIPCKATVVADGLDGSADIFSADLCDGCRKYVEAALVAGVVELRRIVAAASAGRRPPGSVSP